MPERIPQSTTIRVPLQAFLSSDHVSAATSKTIAVTISKNGGAYGNPSAGATNATEIASGSYYVDLSTTDTGTAGPLFVKGSVSGVDDVIAIYDVAADANTFADALLDRSAGVETNRTLRQALRLILSVLAGKASGLGGTTATFRDTNDSKDRIVATVDADGNRSAVTLDAS